jgi:predicted RNase H-like HicB family nuclease
MIDLEYSLIIEATEDPDYFGFYSPDLDGFSGAGNSIDDCLKKAQEALNEHVKLLETEGLRVPPINPNPAVTLHKSERVIPAA